MNFTTNTFGISSPYSQQLQPPMMQGGQYQGPQAMTPIGQMGQPIPGQQPNPMQAAQPGMSDQQKMMLAQMLSNIGNRQQMPQQFNLAGVTGSTLPNSFVG